MAAHDPSSGPRPAHRPDPRPGPGASRFSSGASTPPAPAPSLQDRALEDVQFIRRTMASGVAFTAVPGWGGMAMGGIGLTAALLAARQPTFEGWLAVWLGAAVLAAVTGGVAMTRKARRAGLSLRSGSGRRFAIGFLPPAAAGALLTAALAGNGAEALLPGSWLLLYGVAVLSAGTFSVPAVPAMGAGFFALGTAALLLPGGGAGAIPFHHPALPMGGGATLLLGAGFGGLHLVTGYVIARNHGG